MAGFGEAIAQGIAKGIGDAGQQYYSDQRREKKDVRASARSFEDFKKQQDFSSTQKTLRDKNMAMYNTGLTDITAKNTAKTAWETAAKLSPSDLAYQIATQQSSQFSKEARPAFFRDTMKRLNGMSKTVLMAKAGHVLPDYSMYVDKPEYADAIPSANVGGIDALPDASATFKYDPKTYAAVQKKQGEKMSAYMEKRQDEFKAIDSMGMVTYGATMDDSVKNLIWKNRPEGKGVEMQGAEAVSYDQTYVNALIKTGKVVQVGTQLRIAKEVEMEDAAVAQRTSTTTPETPDGSTGALYTEPRAEELLATKKAKEDKAIQVASVKRVEDKQGKAIKSYTNLGELKTGLTNLSKDAKEILFGGSSFKGLLSLTDVGQQLAAKGDVKGAKEARKFLSLMENISAQLKHEQYGSAQTISELKTFASQLGNPSIFQNIDTLIDQIGTRQGLVRSGIEAGVGAEDRKSYLAGHPEAAELFGETKQTVSDLSDSDAAMITSAPKEYQEELKAALADGTATSAEIAEFLKTLK